MNWSTITTSPGWMSSRSEPTADTLNPTHIEIDAAMEKRDWEKKSALYEPTAVVAGPQGFNYQPQDDLGAVRGTREFAETRYHVWKALHGTPAAQPPMH